MVRPAARWPLLYCYSTYAASALFLVGSLYLFLPILRDTENAGTETIPYSISLFALHWQFSLPWWLPFVLVAAAAWLLALSKRVEFRIARHAHAEFWARYDELCGGEDTRGRIRRRVDSAARTRAMALRWLGLLGLEALKITGILLLLFWLEPVTVPLALAVSAGLMILFRRALWQRRGHVAPAEPGRDQMHKQIHHRVSMENARQVFYALMPITILLLLLLSRVLGSLNFDLADLLFLTLLVSAMGSACAGAVQMLQRLNRLDPAILELWHPLVVGDAQAFFDGLERAGSDPERDQGNDD